MENWKRALLETTLAAASALIFYLFAASLFAVFVRAYAPSQLTISAVGVCLKCVGAFVFSLIFIKKDRALFKGAAAGAAALLVSTLVFGLIGGFRISFFLLAELVLCALFGAIGALCGAKLRKG